MLNINVRQRLEYDEERLSPHAAKSRRSKGRTFKEEPCPLRTEFQRDRDRILYSNAFRRLKHKTQVFISPLDDHYVTRLTHTLEVSQIARTIARALNLNEDLTEAISLGHDLGHTPFGHLGEEILNGLNPDGFKHNEQSLRIVDVLEKNGRGLNLTWEVRDGIVNHSKSYVDIFAEGWGSVGTLEGQVVKIADIIAYINHDTNDAVRAGIIEEKQLPLIVKKRLGASTSERINTLIMDLVTITLPHLQMQDEKRVIIKMSASILEAANVLRNFLFERVYNSKLTTKDRKQVSKTMHLIYQYFYRNTHLLPLEYNVNNDNIDRKVTDYVAGMTDRYALAKAKEIKAADRALINSRQ
jgi:dGTPase